MSVLCYISNIFTRKSFYLSLINTVCPKIVGQFHKPFGNTERHLEKEIENKQTTTKEKGKPFMSDRKNYTFFSWPFPHFLYSITSYQCSFWTWRVHNTPVLFWFSGVQYRSKYAAPFSLRETDWWTDLKVIMDGGRGRSW